VFAKSTIFTLSRFSLLPEISASSVLFRYSHSSPRYPRPHSSPRYPHPRSSVRVLVLVHIHILSPRSSILARSTIFTLPRFSLLPEISASSSSVLVQVLDPRQVHNLTLSLPHPHSDHHQVHKLRSSAILTPRRDILVLILGPLPLSASSVLNPRPHPRPRSTPKSLSASSSTSSVLGPQSASSSTPASSVLGPQSASSSTSSVLGPRSSIRVLIHARILGPRSSIRVLILIRDPHRSPLPHPHCSNLLVRLQIHKTFPNASSNQIHKPVQEPFFDACKR